MKRNYNFGFLAGYRVHDIVLTDGLCEVEDNSELNRLLSVVFAPNSNGVIDGDLAYTMSSNADPQIVKFVKDVLQQDLSNYKQPPVGDLSDSDVENLSYHLGESKQEYAERISEYVRQQKNAYEHAKNDFNESKKD